MHLFMNRYITELDNLKLVQRVWFELLLHVQFITRHPEKPSGRALKIHVDGIVSSNGNIGAATVVCRDHNGIFLGSFGNAVFRVHRSRDPGGTRMSACREAQTLAEDLSISMFIM